MTDLEKARLIINDVDEQMAKLFEKRMEAAKLVASYKQENGLPIDDFAREEQLVNRNTAMIENEIYRPYYSRFLMHTIKLSKEYQHYLLTGMRVAFSGVRGAFADIVAHRVFSGSTIVPYPDFKSAYRSVEKGECHCVLLPVENSFNGDVGQVMDLAFFGKLYIHGIYEAEIVQNLLGVKGTDISKIKKVISHPQALGQCAAFLEKHGFEIEEAVNTAVAAQMVAESGREDLAAIASDEAAEQFGLAKLEARINESRSNVTRFAVFSPIEKAVSPSDERFVLLFTVKDQAGALGKAISVIGDRGFNLRAVKSRPTKELSWNYYFYAEGEGNIGSENGKEMLRELSKYCDTLRVVGSFTKEVLV